MLNKSQAEAKAVIDNWLLDPTGDEMILCGAGGYGKSYLVESIIDSLDDYNATRILQGMKPLRDIHCTATSNKAASVLRGGITIHKLLKLRPKPNFATGETDLVKSDKDHVIMNALIMLDESSMLNVETKELVQSMLINCKLLYVGDKSQLKPVKESVSPVFDVGLPMVELDEPMRQNADSYLFKVCQQLREIVNTGKWTRILEGEGVRFTKGAEGAAVVNEWFHAKMHPSDAKIITFTNDKAIAYNAHVRSICGFSEDWEVGDIVSCRNWCKNLLNNKEMPIETVCEITKIDPKVRDYEGVKYREIELDGELFRVAINYNHYSGVIKQLVKLKSWREVYFLKENFADLRSAFSCTGHVSQGSTYDRVYIDLNDLSICRDLDMLARLLYVAFTRARIEVVLHGELPEYLFTQVEATV